jgi:serine/threonine protein kinase
MLRCPNPEQMCRLTEGDLSVEEVLAIEQHLNECELCALAISTFTSHYEESAGSLADDIAKHEPTVKSLMRTLENLPSKRFPCDREEWNGMLADYLAPPENPEELGRIGPYRVLEKLGQGGMGVVFKAQDSSLLRLVAVKLMRPALLINSSARRRFLREARTASSIRHKHIVVTHYVGEQSGVPFIAMELLEGETLESRLRREPKLPLEAILRIGREIADGLASAHEAGLIHRDIKPSNLWLEADGDNVKILDFGLARYVDGSANLTESGVYLGTPAFMSPEQASGNGPVDGRVDLFSLGCVLYQMCVGVVPFSGEDSLSVLFAIASKNPTPPRRLNPAIPAEFSALILRLLAKDPSKRPSSAAEVRDALEAIPLRKAKRNSLEIFVAGGLAILGLTIVLWLGLANRREPSPPSQSTSVVPELPPRSGLDFDGTSQVTIDDFPISLAGPYTLEADVTARKIQPNRSVVIAAGENFRAFAIEISSYRQPLPKWRFSWKFPWATGEATVPIGQRQHLAATFTGKVGAMFVDGKCEGRMVSPVDISPTETVPVIFGKNFVGTIHQIRISRGCRYTGDFTPAAVLASDSDTLALYRFDEGVGNVVNDSSGNGRLGAVIGATWTPK